MSEEEEEPANIKVELKGDALETVAGDALAPEPVEAAQALPENLALFDLSQAGCLLFIALLVATVLGTASLGLSNLLQQTDGGVQTGESTAIMIFMEMATIILATSLVLVFLGPSIIKRRRATRSN